MAGALARARQHEQAAEVADQAKTAARSITDPDRQAKALTAVARALAQAGQAADVARSITDADGQARALAEVAETLVAREATGQARRVASAACAARRWTTMLGLVLSLEPSAVGALTEPNYRHQQGETRLPGSQGARQQT